MGPLEPGVPFGRSNGLVQRPWRRSSRKGNHASTGGFNSLFADGQDELGRPLRPYLTMTRNVDFRGDGHISGERRDEVFS